MQYYSFFQDEMIEGDFKKMIHQHHFKSIEDTVMITDIFDFETPFGLIGRIANAAFLTDYMKRLLQKRNNTIKECAETEKWKTILYEY